MQKQNQFNFFLFIFPLHVKQSVKNALVLRLPRGFEGLATRQAPFSIDIVNCQQELSEIQNLSENAVVIEFGCGMEILMFHSMAGCLSAYPYHFWKGKYRHSSCQIHSSIFVLHVEYKTSI